MADETTRVLVLGASGLIGSFLAGDLSRRGFRVVAAARRFSPAQKAMLGGEARELPLVGLDIGALTQLLDQSSADVVINCVGVLQDNLADKTQEVHVAFVARLIAALRSADRPVLLVHLSVPGNEAGDHTKFSRSKRRADRTIEGSGLSYVILRPGVVLAPSASGGSAMLRALAAWPVALPGALGSKPLSIAAVEDIAETVALLVHGCAQKWAATWDLVHPDRPTIADVLARFRKWLGMQAQFRVVVPMVLLRVAGLAGDFASLLGWRASIRSTALAEMRRGVSGDPRAWMEATGIMPRALDEILRARPATLQEKWFARLYLLKPLIIAALVVFWCASALIALTVAYRPAVAILTTHGYADWAAQFMTIAGGLTDFAVGVAIAMRRTSRHGLLAGIAVSLFYMIAAAILTPDLWIEPLGALVKTIPAIILMVVALAIGDDR
jgi:uncharacterized protein YbjT (DUF2867 family)